MVSPVHNILIIGGSLAGISEAHYLLRHTLPALSNESANPYKIILLSESSKFYWKVGSPRGIVNPSLIPLSESFISITDGFKEYSESNFEFIQGSATHLDSAAKTLQVSLPGKTALSPISYNSLVITTGTKSNSPLYSLAGPHEITQTALEDIHARLPAAQSILVAGGGPAGTETAGELGAEYGSNKDITILSGGDRLLPQLNSKTSSEAETRLEKLGVKVRHRVRVASTKSSEEGKTLVLLGDGTEIAVDVYIDATGGTPNTSFLPREWLDERGFVKTEKSSLRLDVPGVSNVYAFGTVTSFSNGSYMDVVDAVRPVAESIRLDQRSTFTASKQQDPVYPTSWWTWATIYPTDPLKRMATFEQKTAEIQFVPIGTEGGVGVLFGWRIPSFMVYKVKARTFMIEKARQVINGDDFKTL